MSPWACIIRRRTYDAGMHSGVDGAREWKPARRSETAARTDFVVDAALESSADGSGASCSESGERGRRAATVPRPSQRARGTRLAGRVRRRRTRANTTIEAPLERVRALDERLFELAFGVGRDWLELGALLNAFAQKAWHHELGYSSLEAYALQNCGRSARWVSETRTLARRLAELPALREALLSGRIGWSMAELVARHATPDADVALGGAGGAVDGAADAESAGCGVAAGSERPGAGAGPCGIHRGPNVRGW